MPTFDLINTYAKSSDGISVTPHWVLLVIPFANQSTFDRTRTNDGSRSYNDSDEYAIAEAPPIIISSDCVALRTGSSKASHVAPLEATLKPSRTYTDEVNEGDWVMAWMLNSSDDAETLVKRIRARQPCNRIQDGFKFMGRVQSINEDFINGPEGDRRLTYQLTAAGFTEFDSPILYFPQIQLNLGGDLPQWWQDFGLYLEQITHAQDTADADAGTLNINAVLPNLLKIMLGEGLPPRGALDDDPRLLLSPNRSAYLVPRTVSALLGRASSRGTPTYADLLEGLIGVQHYSGGTRPEDVFFPDVRDAGPFYSTTNGLAGEFVPLPPPLDLVPVWNVLGMFLNSSINEMYTTLRLNKFGQVVPYFVARQLPFTTALGAANRNGLPHVTEFLNLPRWKIHPNLIKSYSLGKSEVVRFNMVQAQGVTSGVPQDAAFLWTLNPPVRDDADMKRSGLRPFTRVVNCSFNDSQKGARAWTNTLADFMMGMSRTRNGRLTLFGVHAPIAVGDNVDLLGNVYHIEAIQHAAMQDDEGRRTYETVLSLSHGMAGEESVRRRLEAGEPLHTAQYIKGSPSSLVNAVEM